MVVSGVGDSGPLVVYLFGDAAEETSTGSFRWSAGHASSGGLLTAREIEVLRVRSGLGCAAHSGGDGTESAYGAEPLDEPAAEVGCELELGSGDGSGAVGRVEVRRRWARNRRKLNSVNRPVYRARG